MIRPTIGVVLCTYNGAQYLRMQVESIFAQSRKPELLLAFDDGSTDGTVELLQDMSRRAPFSFKVVQNDANLGFVQNFEQAIAKCGTDIIALSDQDDWWQPTKLSAIERVFISDPAANAVFSDAEIVRQDLRSTGQTLVGVRATGLDRADLRSGSIFTVLLRRNVVCGASLAIRSGTRKSVLPIPGAAVHDEWIALATAAHDGLRFIENPLIKYRQHGSNQIGIRSRNWVNRLATLMHRHGPETARRLGVMRHLRERLASHEVPRPQEVDGVIAHLEHRLSLSGVCLRRMTAISHEIRSGGYEKYSTGWASAVRDFVLPM